MFNRYVSFPEGSSVKKIAKLVNRTAITLGFMVLVTMMLDGVINQQTSRLKAPHG